MTYIVDRRNLDFFLFEMLGVETLLATDYYAHCDRSMVMQFFDAAQRLAEEVYLRLAARWDACPPALVNGEIEVIPDVGRALKAYIASFGWLSSSMTPAFHSCKSRSREPNA